METFVDLLLMTQIMKHVCHLVAITHHCSLCPEINDVSNTEALKDDVPETDVSSK